MYHKFMEYLLDTEPQKVMSKTGLQLRKMFYSIFLHILVPLSTQNHLHIENNVILPSEKRLIFAPTHAFRDDIAFSIVAAQRHCYLLIGALNILFASWRGFALWLNGVIAVDRFDKASRQSSMKKMVYALQMGVDIIMFPEATWNLSENQLVLPLFPGVYDLAMHTGALVVPIASIEDGDIVHVSIDDAFDITEYGREEGIQILRDKLATAKYELMDKYSHAKRTEIGDAKTYWKQYTEKLIQQSDGLYRKFDERRASFTKPSQPTKRHFII